MTEVPQTDGPVVGGSEEEVRSRGNKFRVLNLLLVQTMIPDLVQDKREQGKQITIKYCQAVAATSRMRGEARPHGS